MSSRLLPSPPAETNRVCEVSNGVRPHLVLPVASGGAAVKQLSFILVSADLLTQGAEVSHRRSDKLQPRRGSSSAELTLAGVHSYVALTLPSLTGLLGVGGSAAPPAGSPTCFLGLDQTVLRRAAEVKVQAKSSFSKEYERRWAEPTAQACQNPSRDLKVCSYLRGSPGLPGDT